MKKILLVILLIAGNIAMASGKKSIGYYYLWSKSSIPHTAIKYENLTHLVHAFIKPNSDGSLALESGFLYPELVQAAHKNGVKIIVALGGYGNSEGFSPMVADSNARKKFVSNLVTFCKTNGYDGADLDWEYPAAKDRDNLTKLITQMRTAFDAAGLEIISAAMPSSDWSGGYDIPAIKDKMSWFGLMTYDFHGNWAPYHAGHNSPLYSSPYDNDGSTESSVQGYIAKGMPKDKLCIGVATYGRIFNATKLFAASTGGGALSYTDANNRIAQGWEYYWDDNSKVPYLQDKAHTQVITYDDTLSFRVKSDYILKNNLAGTIIWEMKYDYANGKQPLMDVLGNYLLKPDTTAPSVSPVLVSPFNGSKGDTVVLTFKWNKVNRAVSYTVQISADSAFTAPFVNRANLNFPQYAVRGLKYNTKYYWRACAANYKGNGPWSEIYSFTTKLLSTEVAQENNNTVPSAFSVENFPNPFNPSTTIRYSIPSDIKGMVNVQLKVFNILGKEMASLVNESKSAGTYEVKFDASALASGIYFYQFNAGRYTKTGKMILSK